MNRARSQGRRGQKQEATRDSDSSKDRKVKEAGTKGQQRQAKTEKSPESSSGTGQEQGPVLQPPPQGSRVRAPVTTGPQKYPGILQPSSAWPESYVHILEVVMK